MRSTWLRVAFTMLDRSPLTRSVRATRSAPDGGESIEARGPAGRVAAGTAERRLGQESSYGWLVHRAGTRVQFTDQPGKSPTGVS